MAEHAQAPDQAGVAEPASALAHAPALSLVAAIGAWLALLLQKIILPALSHKAPHEALLRLGNWGEFGTNLAAVAGIPALLIGPNAFMRPNGYLRPGRRTLIGGFTLLLTSMTLWATFFDRTQTTRAIVFYGLGAAHVLSVLLVMGALAYCRTASDRCLAVAIAAMGLFGLLGHVLELLAATRLSLGASARWMRGIGEVGYLVALLSVTFSLVQAARSRREAAASFLTFLAFGVLLASFVLASRTLGNDFGLVLYHAQRLRLMLDVSPLAYAFPLCLAAAAGLGGLLAPQAEQRQLGTGALLLLSAGYTPRSPAQLLMMALSALLLARALIARGER